MRIDSAKTHKINRRQSVSLLVSFLSVTELKGIAAIVHGISIKSASPKIAWKATMIATRLFGAATYVVFGSDWSRRQRRCLRLERARQPLCALLAKASAIVHRIHYMDGEEYHIIYAIHSLSFITSCWNLDMGLVLSDFPYSQHGFLLWYLSLCTYIFKDVTGLSWSMNN